MDIQEIRAKSESDLGNELSELLQEQFNLRMQKGTGQLAQAHALRRVRRNIARVKTIMGEKKREGSDS
jgi:large subunit ribosomal protein L29